MKCNDCGKEHFEGNEYFCPQCEDKHHKRDVFRERMTFLQNVANMDRIDGSFMSGFSYAEMERFSLIMKKIIKKYHFPDKDQEFVNSLAKKELEELKKTYIF